MAYGQLTNLRYILDAVPLAACIKRFYAALQRLVASEAVWGGL